MRSYGTKINRDTSQPRAPLTEKQKKRIEQLKREEVKEQVRTEDRQAAPEE